MTDILIEFANCCIILIDKAIFFWSNYTYLNTFAYYYLRKIPLIDKILMDCMSPLEPTTMAAVEGPAIITLQLKQKPPNPYVVTWRRSFIFKPTTHHHERSCSSTKSIFWTKIRCSYWTKNNAIASRIFDSGRSLSAKHHRMQQRESGARRWGRCTENSLFSPTMAWTWNRTSGRTEVSKWIAITWR